MSKTSTSSANQGKAGVPVRRRRGRRLVIALGVLVVLVVVLLALLPTIASSVAPGIIESAAAKSIAGKVKVEKVALGWFSAASAGPITLSDDKGEKVASVRAETQLTLMKVLSGRMWSATDLDLGTITLSGDVDLIQEADGRTNLDRALAQPAGKAPGTSTQQQTSAGGASAGRAIKASLKLDTLTLTRRVRGADGKTGEATGVKDLGGQMDVALDTRSGLTAIAKGKLAGKPVGPGAASGATMVVELNADVKQGVAAPGVSAVASLERAKIELIVQGAPVALVDGLAGLGGGLLASAGESADVRVVVDGTLRAMEGSMVVTSSGLNVRLPLQIKDGIVRSGGLVPGSGAEAGARTLTLKTTEGLSLVPQLRVLGETLSRQVRLSQWPTLEITLEQLRLPSPVDVNGKPSDLKVVDFRGAAVVLKVRASEMAGQVLVQDGAGGASTDTSGASGATASTGSWKAFRTEPIEVTINVPDLAQGLNLAGGTRATLDNQPAGDVTIRAIAAGLLDERGHVRALLESGGIANSLDAELLIKGLSTALIAPIVSGMGLPVDVREDVGPTATLGITAKMSGELSAATGQGGLASLPPVDVRVNLDAANMSVAGALRLEKGILTTVGDSGASGVTARVISGAALVRRLTLDAAGKDPGLIAGGRGGMELSITGLRADLNKMTPAKDAGTSSAGVAPLTAIAATVHAGVTDLSVRLPSGETAPGAAAAKALVPIKVQTLTFDLIASPGVAPKLKLDSALMCEGAPFTMAGDLTLDGLASGKMPALNGTPIDKLLAIRPIGKVGLYQVPSGITAALPMGAGPTAAASADDAAGADPMAMAMGLMGKWVSVSVQFATDQEQPAQHAARLLVETDSKAMGLSMLTKLGTNQATIAAGQAFFKADPGTLNPILERMMPAKANEAGNTARGISVNGPSTVWVKVVQPITVPLEKDASGGGLKPNLEKATDAVVSITTQGEVGVAGISLGGDGSPATPFKYLDVQLVVLAGEARAPTGSLGNAPTRPPITATIATEVLRGDRRPIGGVNAVVSIAGNRSNGSTTNATVTIDRLSTATLDDTLALDGLLQGFVGDTAKISVETQISSSQAATPAAGTGAASAPAGTASRMTLKAGIEAPRITGASVRLEKDEDRFALVDPAAITITPDPAFINRLAGSANIPVATSSQPAAAKPKDKKSGDDIGQAIGGLFGGRKESSAAPTPAAKDLVTKMKLLDASKFNVRLNKLAVAIPKGETTVGSQVRAAVGLFRPGVFDLDVAFDTEKLGLEVVQVSRDGVAAYNPVRASFSGIRGSAKSIAPGSSDEGPGVQVAMDIDRVTSTEVSGAAAGSGAAGVGKPSKLSASVSRIADRMGNLNMANAVISADADVSEFPTPIADQLAGQNGLMTEVLGTTVSLRAKVRNVSKSSEGAQSGSIDATATSPRASATVMGDVRGGEFIQTGKTTVTLTQISPQLVDMLSGGVPIVDSLEKTAQDEPATIEFTNFRAPLDSDLSKLNGKLAVDLGVARFTTKSVFGQIIKAAGGKESGTIGRKIEPFMVTANSGVLDYQRFKLPLGEFSLETQGQVDLVGKQIRVTTYAPFFAIAEEALGPIKLGIGGKIDLIDRNTKVPITTRGSLSNPKTEIDVGAFLKDLGGNIIKAPGGLLEDLLGGGKDKGNDGAAKDDGSKAPTAGDPKKEQKPKRGLNPFNPNKPKEEPK